MGDTKPPDRRYGLVQAASRLTTRATSLSKSRKVALVDLVDSCTGRLYFTGNLLKYSR